MPNPPRYILSRLTATELAKSSALSTDEGKTLAACVVIPCLPEAENIEALAEVLQQRAGQPFRTLVVDDDLGQGPAGLLNLAFRQTKEPLFAYLAQDAFPGRQWLARGIKTLIDKKAGLLAFNDGKWAGQIAAFGLVRRDWCTRVYGGKSLFFSGYRQHYGDAELSLIARQHKSYAYDPDAVVMEVDFEKDGRSVDANDRALFAQRKLTGFDGRVSDTQLLGLLG